jgi:hypothetical protein
VIFLNGAVASMQVALAVRVLSMGSEQAPGTPKLVIYDAQAQRAFPAAVSYSPECATCGIEGVTGVGDLAPLRPAPTVGFASAPASLSLVTGASRS